MPQRRTTRPQSAMTAASWLFPIVIVQILAGIKGDDGPLPPKAVNLIVSSVTDTTIALQWSLSGSFDPSLTGKFILRYGNSISSSRKTAIGGESVSPTARSFVYTGLKDGGFGIALKVVSAYDGGKRVFSKEIVVHLKDGPNPTNSSSPNLQCEQYTGSVCAGLLTHGMFYVNSSQDQKEKEVLAAKALGYFDGRGACVEESLIVAKRMACDMIFQPCHPKLLFADNLARARPVCRQDCLAASDGDCSSEWRKISALLRVQCDDLPSVNGGEEPECLRYGTAGADGLGVLRSSNCYYGDGQGYTGKEGKTSSGITCLPWYHENLGDEKQLLFGYNVSVLKSWGAYCRNPEGRGEHPWCYTGGVTGITWDYCSIPKCGEEIECDDYESSWIRHEGIKVQKLCQDMPGFRNYGVYVNTSERFVFEIDYQIDAVIHDLNLPNQMECRDEAFNLICYSSLPLCVNRHPVQAHRICRDTCQAWARCSNGVKIGTRLDGLLSEDSIGKWEKLAWNNCSSSPEKNGGEAPECIDDMQVFMMKNGASLPRNATVNASDLCYDTRKSGVSYRGTFNMTEGNRRCAPWNASHPHSHEFISQALYPELADNYCRNPGKRGERPWCYTMDPNVRWEYCNVTKCVYTPAPSSPVPPLTPGAIDEEGISPALIGAIAGGFTCLIILACVIVGCQVNKRKKEKLALRQGLGPVRLLSLSLSRGRSNSSAVENNPLYMEKIACPEVAEDNIVFDSDLGEGNFGKVFKGLVHGLVEGEEVTTVAVKTLKTDSNDRMRGDFYREAQLMSNFSHQNIIRLMGVCLDVHGPIYLLFEYMSLGDLNKFLHDHAGNYHKKGYYYESVGRSHSQSSTLSDSLAAKPSLSVEQLVQIATQIAAGMNYLSHRRYVHRDLATRNCLVAEGLVVKIADFGMSQDIYSMDYYRVGGAALLPVRWMPPEAIIYGKSTVESDVWSFGVVLWEIFSFAMQPYFGLSNEETIDAVRKGRQLSRPDDCPQPMYNLMKGCWNIEPEERPSFKKLHRRLSDWNPAMMSGSLAHGSASVTTYDHSPESSAEDPDDVFHVVNDSLTVELPPFGETNGVKHANGKVPREGKDSEANGHTKLNHTVSSAV
eukprot:m.42197 g.42197  ORF g.42197 m.42197 type:complete len:1111 (+) comp33335_c0_seq5:116-3448(+)